MLRKLTLPNHIWETTPLPISIILAESMAERILKKVEDELTCPICLETFTDPKLLQCFHVYCRACLVKLLARDQDQQRLTCPTCRQLTSIPDSGVSGLQSAFHINHLLDIMREREESGADSDSTSMAASSEKSAPLCCEVHTQHKVELYCNTCDILLCYKCVVNAGEHHSHDYELISEAFERYKGGVDAMLEPVKKQMTTLDQVLAQVGTRCREITDQRASIEAIITKGIRKLQEALEVRKTELVDQLDKITEDKLEHLSDQRGAVMTARNQLKSFLDFMDGSVKTDRQSEVMKMKPIVDIQVKELATSNRQSYLMKPCTEADMAYSASTSADIAAACRDYGCVLLKSTFESLDSARCHRAKDASDLLNTAMIVTEKAPSPEPSNCYAIGRGIKVAHMGEMATATVCFADPQGKPCVGKVKSFECELVSEMTGAVCASTTFKGGPTGYDITYEPALKGRHRLSVKLDGQHIKGSPFIVAVMSSVRFLGDCIRLVTSLEGVRCVAQSPHTGEVFVTNYNDCCVYVLGPNGEILRSFGQKGSGQGQLQSPLGVAVDGNGDVFVTDSGNHRIVKFSPDGGFLNAVGSSGEGPLRFTNPRGLACNTANGRIYVVDNTEHCVHILNSDLSFSNTFGGGACAGSERELSYPWGVACSSEGLVYVADSNNNRVVVFSADGVFLQTFGTCGSSHGDLSWPVDVAVGTDGSVYVSEDDNHRVSVFDSNGAFLMCFGEEGSLNHPRGLAVDECGVVYVCDKKSSFQIF